MKEFKGTKGPWEFAKWNGEKWPEKRWSIHSKDNGAIAISPRFFTEQIESHYNAKLISKAPEMLEMLKIVTEKLNDYSQLFGYDESKIVGESEKLIKEATEL